MVQHAGSRYCYAKHSAGKFCKGAHTRDACVSERSPDHRPPTDEVQALRGALVAAWNSSDALADQVRNGAAEAAAIIANIDAWHGRFSDLDQLAAGLRETRALLDRLRQRLMG